MAYEIAFSHHYLVEPEVGAEVLYIKTCQRIRSLVSKIQVRESAAEAFCIKFPSSDLLEHVVNFTNRHSCKKVSRTGRSIFSSFVYSNVHQR